MLIHGSGHDHASCLLHGDQDMRYRNGLENAAAVPQICILIHNATLAELSMNDIVFTACLVPRFVPGCVTLPLVFLM